MRRRGRRVGSLLGAAALLTALAAAAVLLARPSGGGPVRPATAAPSPVPMPDRTPLLSGLPPDAPVPTTAGLVAALTKGVGDPALGPSLGLSVLDVGTGRPLLEVSAASPMAPASTAKLLTAAAALAQLGADFRITTVVVAGPGPGEVVLVGGGDPTLTAGPGPTSGPAAPASLADLARQVRAVSGPVPVRRVLVDDTLFTGPSTGPGWRPDYVSSGNVAPVSALAVEEGRVRRDRPARVADPAMAAGSAFARLLDPGGRLPVARGRPGPGGRELGRVQSPPLVDLVEQMLVSSDNDLAEALARQVALAAHAPGSFEGAGTAVTAGAVSLLGPAAGGSHLVDGSGLSRVDRVPPAALARLVVLAAGGSHPELSGLLSGLPVAHFTGTLADRYTTSPAAAAAGLVRAKTGTLEGVTTLAGLVRTREGRLLAFSFAADRVPKGGVALAERGVDRLAAVLAGCGCR